MKILFIIAGLMFSTGIFAQETTVIQDANAHPRSLNASFTGIRLSDGITLFLTQSNVESLAVSYNSEDVGDRLKTEVENGTLKIYFDHQGFRNKKRNIKVYVSCKTLEKLDMSSGSTVKLQSSLKVENIDMKITSGAVFNGKIEGGNIEIDQNSGSVVNILGSASGLKITVSSGADFRGHEMAVTTCNAKASSGARIHIEVKEELNAQASSGGGVYYKGAAVIKDVNISSGGVVKKA